jgi:hypothetical protein
MLAVRTYRFKGSKLPGGEFTPQITAGNYHLMTTRIDPKLWAPRGQPEELIRYNYTTPICCETQQASDQRAIEVAQVCSDLRHHTDRVGAVGMRASDGTCHMMVCIRGEPWALFRVVADGDHLTPWMAWNPAEAMAVAGDIMDVLTEYRMTWATREIKPMAIPVEIPRDPPEREKARVV